MSERVNERWVVKLPHWFRGSPPSKPSRGVSADLASVFVARVAPLKTDQENARYQNYMGIAIEAALGQEAREQAAWQKKMAEWRSPLEVDAVQFVAWSAVAIAITALVVMMWNV